MNLGRLTPVLRDTVRGWNQHEAQRLGASLSFYAIVSLAPLLVFLTPILSRILAIQMVSDRIVSDALVLIGPSGAETVQQLLGNVRTPEHGVIAGALASFTLLFGASSVFTELRDALNIIWEVKTPGESLRGFIAGKMFSFLLVLGAGILLLVSMLATALVASLGQSFVSPIQFPGVVLEVVNFTVSFAVLSVVFALIYRFVPERVFPWRVLWIGAAVTAFLFVIGKTLLGLYLSWASVGSIYGVGGSLAVVAIWVYYSAQIFLLGAEFTRVYAVRVAAPASDALLNQ